MTAQRGPAERILLLVNTRRACAASDSVSSCARCLITPIAATLGCINEKKNITSFIFPLPIFFFVRPKRTRQQKATWFFFFFVCMFFSIRTVRGNCIQTILLRI